MISRSTNSSNSCRSLVYDRAPISGSLPDGFPYLAFALRALLPSSPQVPPAECSSCVQEQQRERFCRVVAATPELHSYTVRFFLRVLLDCFLNTSTPPGYAKKPCNLGQTLEFLDDSHQNYWLSTVSHTLPGINCPESQFLNKKSCSTEPKVYKVW